MDELCSFVGHVMGIECLFIEKMREMSAAAFEEERIEGLAGDARDPSEVESEFDQAESVEGFLGL